MHQKRSLGDLIAVGRSAIDETEAWVRRDRLAIVAGEPRPDGVREAGPEALVGAEAAYRAELGRLYG